MAAFPNNSPALAGELSRPPDAAPIRVLIVGDVRLYREGMADIIGRARHVDVVGATGTDDAVARVGALQPDIVLFDAIRPEGCRVVREMLSVAPATRVVAVSVSDSGDAVIALGEAGVTGYVSREGSVADVIEMLERVRQGEMAVPPEVAATLLDHVRNRNGAPASDIDTSHLTSREMEILELLEAGLSNKQIATQLSIAPATVKNHVHNILMKLDVSRRIDLASRARFRRRDA